MTTRILKLSAVSFVALTALIPALSQDAHAYIDPSSMGMMLQVIIAGVAGGAFFFRRGFTETKALVKRLFSKKS